MKSFGDIFVNSLAEFKDKFLSILKTFLMVFLIPSLILAFLFVLVFGTFLGIGVAKTGNIDLFLNNLMYIRLKHLTCLRN